MIEDKGSIGSRYVGGTAGLASSPSFYSSVGDLLGKSPSILRQMVAKTPAIMIGELVGGNLHKMGVNAEQEDISQQAQLLADQNPNMYREQGIPRDFLAEQELRKQKEDHLNSLYNVQDVTLNDLGIPITLPTSALTPMAKQIHNIGAPIGRALFDVIPDAVGNALTPQPVELDNASEYYFADSQTTMPTAVPPPVIASTPQVPQAPPRLPHFPDHKLVSGEYPDPRKFADPNLRLLADLPPPELPPMPPDYNSSNPLPPLPMPPNYDPNVPLPPLPVMPSYDTGDASVDEVLRNLDGL